MKRIYLWLIPLSLVWPLVHLLVFFMRFQKLPPNGIIEIVDFLPFSLLGAFIFLYAWDKASSQVQKLLSVLGYLLASPFAFIGSLGGGLLFPYIGPAIFGAVPLIIGTSLGFFIGRYVIVMEETDQPSMYTLDTQAHLPYCSPLQTWVGRSILRLFGWQAEGQAPAVNKCVAVFAPHTSNWDFIYMLAAVYVLGIRPNWFGKQELFDSILGPLFRRLGGIGIDRRTKHNRVQQTVEVFRQQERIILGITPEGTRSRTSYWKTGFYNIATQAQIPILLIYADYARKHTGVGPLLEPTGDLEADLQIMAEFFNQVTPKFPEEVGPITIRPQTI